MLRARTGIRATRWRWAWALGWLLAATLGWAQPLQPVPALQGRVVDTTGTLDAAGQAQLEAALARLESERGAQVVVLLVATTQPEDIASYANRVANAWKIGRRDVGDGVLLLVAKNDRRLRIEVAKALEGAIPDLAAKRIIDEAITPRLRQGDYAGALAAGVAQIDARIRAEGLPLPGDRETARDDGWDADLPLLFVALFFVVPAAAAVLRGVFGRKLGALATGAGAGAFTLLFLQLGWWLAIAAAAIAFVVALLSGGFGLPSSGPSVRRGRDRDRGGWIGGGMGGGGGFGGGGGGFSSGGGGDFGGGGASGDW